MAECITLFARLLVTSSTLSTAHLPHITLSTHQFFVYFLVGILTFWVTFYRPTANPTAKKRFSRRLVLMQKGLAC